MLAEFASVVHAVSCAIEIQRELRERNAELPDDRRLEYRIGVNLGDVIEEGERIYGDGVNIAARLESLAEPGGICISGSVYQEAKSKLKPECEDLGEKIVKNIEEPVQVYRVLMGTEAAEKKTSSLSWRKVAIVLGVIFLLLAGAAGVIWNVYFRLPDVKGMTEGKKDFELPKGPSIAVLPFVNMSDDPKQQYFSDGLTETIIAGLSADERLLVIARNSTFAFKGKSVDVQEVARKLGAQYVVEGSVQKTEGRVRITVQLINANTGHHVWSDIYDRDLKDIFVLQDEITIKIITGVGMKLVTGEQYKERLLPPSGSLEVYIKFLNALDYHSRLNREGNILCRKELEEAIALDPEYSFLYSLLGMTHLLDLVYQTNESPLISFAQASKNIKKALALDNENWFAHNVLSYLYLLRNEYDKAIGAAQEAIAINPNAADAYVMLGWVLTCSGKAEEAINLIKKGMRLNPFPPPHYQLWLGHTYRLLAQYRKAIEVYEKILERHPDNLWAHIWLTATYNTLGHEEEARQHAEELIRLDPTFSVEQYGETVPIKDKAEVERLVADLREAGLK